MFRVNGLYGHVERNNARSLVMLAGFVLAAQVVLAAAAALPLMFLDPGNAPLTSPLGYAATYGPLSLAVTLLLFGWHLRAHVSRMRRVTGFRDLGAGEERRLVGIVERMAILAGISPPGVCIIETDAMNAFACGLTRGYARIVVTRGLLDGLDDEELEAVVAHETAHIARNDIRLLACVNAMTAMVDALRVFMRSPNKKGSSAQSLFFGLFFPPILLLYGIIWLADHGAAALVRRSRFAINSSREFVADAEAVRWTQNPAALVSALRRIEGRSDLGRVDMVTCAMMIDGMALGPDATHPSIEERVRVLAAVVGAVTMPRSSARDTRPGAMTAREAEALAGTRGGFGRRRTGPSAIAARSVPHVSSQADPPRFEPVAAATPVTAGIDGRTLPPAWIAVAAIVVVALFVMPLRAVLPQASAVPISGGPGGPGGLISVSTTSTARPGTGSAAGRPGDAAYRKLVALPPQSARCFAASYRVRDKVRRMGRADPVEVRAWARGGRWGTPTDMDRFAGLHLRAVRAIPREPGAIQDKALVEYLRARKRGLVSAHRHFGKPGLERMRRLQAGTGDIRALELLRLRVATGRRLTRDERTAQEIALMLADPKGFIPCRARAMGLA